MVISICSGLPNPTRSLNKIVCRGQEGLQGSKGILKPDIHAGLFLTYAFLKNQCHHEKQKGDCKFVFTFYNY
jgi:hypothetical protein